MAANCSDVVVVVVPFLPFGHLNPALRLSRLISSYDLPVYFATVGSRNRELKLRLKDWKLEDFPNLHLHDLPVPRSADEELEVFEYVELFKIAQLLCEPLSALCRELSSTCRRLVIIHDTFMLHYIQGLRHEFATNVETYIFHGFPALSLYAWIQEVTRSNKSHLDHDDLFSPLEPHFHPMDSSFLPGMPGFVKGLLELTPKSAGQIMNTCRDLEGRFLDALAKISGRPMWGLGPLNPLQVRSDKKNAPHKCIEWLDKQPKHSVIFVSFGTSTTFSSEQINELALGLERCEHRFIWVLRAEDKKGKQFKTECAQEIELPTGFEERVAERGIIARDWVPQLEILAHPSTGGYLFHSGGGSFMESIAMGVPMATWPMHSDNPFNDVLITKVLKVGVVVRDWARKDELLPSDEIANALKTLMNSPEGDEIRKRATELSEAIKKSFSEGGTTQKQMESFIAHITR